jgi:hypothetical protein
MPVIVLDDLVFVVIRLLGAAGHTCSTSRNAGWGVVPGDYESILRNANNASNHNARAKMSSAAFIQGGSTMMFQATCPLGGSLVGMVPSHKNAIRNKTPTMASKYRNAFMSTPIRCISLNPRGRAHLRAYLKVRCEMVRNKFSKA